MIRAGLIIALLLTVLTGCEKSPKCWGGNQYKGIIIEPITLSDNCSMLTEEECFVVATDHEYQELAQYLHGEANWCSLKSIDFSKYSIIGRSFYGGCKSKYICEVEEDTDNQQYVFTLRIRNCGNCEHTNYIENWMLVPAIPAGYDVLFKYDRK